jgi:hypothetical protein
MVGVRKIMKQATDSSIQLVLHRTLQRSELYAAMMRHFLKEIGQVQNGGEKKT